jgi:hypothetical protein
VVKEFNLALENDRLLNTVELMDFCQRHQNQHILIHVNNEAHCLDYCGVYSILERYQFQSMFQHPGSYYPIQIPANLNLVNFYHDIFVDIVTEPNIMGQNFLTTEKLWRCIIARRPFIVLGTGSYLHNLRKLGFQTFGQWWSEDYDGQIGQTRIGMMLGIINEIAQWEKEKLAAVLKEMQPTLEHNYDIFMQLHFGKIKGTFNVQ